MPPDLDARTEQVRALVREALGAEPLRVSHMDFGHNSVTFDVTLPARSVIVRTNTDPAVFTHTEYNLSALARLGLPVPRVVAADLTQRRHPFAYLLLEKIPGRDLRYELASMSEAQMTRLAAQIAGFQRTVMSLPPGVGFGYVPLGQPGTHATWWDLIGPDPADAGEARLARLIQAREPYFRQVPPTCFLDDVTTKNVIVQNGELQGLVDFDVVCYGDPLYWLGLTATAIVCDVGKRELFYVDELCRLLELTPDQRQVFSLYAAWIALDFVRRFAAQETPEWWARMEETRERWLTQAG